MDSPLAEGLEASMSLGQRPRATVQGSACCDSSRSSIIFNAHATHVPDLDAEIPVHNHSPFGETQTSAVVQPFSDMRPEGNPFGSESPCHAALSVPSCLRSLSAMAFSTSRGKKARFCPEVSFWFPAHDQLVLPFASHQRLRAHSGGSCRSWVPKAHGDSAGAPRSDVLYGPALSGGCCRPWVPDAPFIPVLRLADFLSSLAHRFDVSGDSLPQDAVAGGAKPKARSRPGRVARAKAKLPSLHERRPRISGPLSLVVLLAFLTKVPMPALILCMAFGCVRD